jgi:hypothetical protein
MGYGSALCEVLGGLYHVLKSTSVARCDICLPMCSDYQLRLNYTICLVNADKTVLAIEQYHEFVRALDAAAAEDEDDELKTDPDIVTRRDALIKALNIM